LALVVVVGELAVVAVVGRLEAAHRQGFARWRDVA
jgi:hypothetical protein